MDVTSLGLRTDLALLQLSGTQIEDCDDHLVVRSLHNPLHWWGNFLLLSGVPAADDTDRWLARFEEAFPDAKHRTFAFDGTTGTVEDLHAFTERGLSCEAQTVMTATAVHAPPKPNTEATYRRLDSDDDWAQSVTLRTACDDGEEDPADRLEYDTLKTKSNRAMAEAGHGGWFGAFVDDQLVSQMGLYRASEGLARFQSVETHPDFRGRGLAGTLVQHVSQVGFSELDARTLVMVADPTYLAIRVYRAVGFTDSESSLQAEKGPGTGA